MKLDANSLNEIISIQEQNNISDNGLLLFSYAIDKQNISSIKHLQSILNMDNELIGEYFSLLLKAELTHKRDEQFFSKVVKTEVVPEEKKEEELKSHFTKEAEEIIDHLGSLVNIKFRHTKKRIAIIESKLLQDFTVEQCKLLNLYFFEEWHNNVDMKQHLTIETLYNEKFITRIEISQKAFVDIIKYNETIKKICSFFAITYSKILQNIDISSKIEADGNDILKLVSIKTQRAIAIWAERGIPEQDIMDTIYYCILEWSKRKELITKISLTKILDSKFLERLEICTRKKQLAQGLISTNSNKNLEIEKWQYKN